MQAVYYLLSVDYLRPNSLFLWFWVLLVDGLRLIFRIGFGRSWLIGFGWCSWACSYFLANMILRSPHHSLRSLFIFISRGLWDIVIEAKEGWDLLGVMGVINSIRKLINFINSKLNLKFSIKVAKFVLKNNGQEKQVCLFLRNWGIWAHATKTIHALAKKRLSAWGCWNQNWGLNDCASLWWSSRAKVSVFATSRIILFVS
jgi:hypothetical protein